MTGRRVFVFPKLRLAEQAYQVLHEAGFGPEQLSLFAHANPSPSRSESTGADRAADVGGAAGAELGGLGGALAGLGLLSAAAGGPLLAVGPLAAALTGALTGGALGGVAGSLAGLGVAQAEAFATEQHLKAGRAVLVVDCMERCADAERLAAEAGALMRDDL